MKKNTWISLFIALIAVGAIVWTLTRSSPTHGPVLTPPDATAPPASKLPITDLAVPDSPPPAARENASPDVPPVPVEAVPVPAAITPPPRAVVTGIVLASDGLPVAEAGIHVHYAGEPDTRLSSDDDRFPVAKPHVLTDSAGRFRIEDARPGTLEVIAVHPRYCHSEWKELRLAPESTVEVTLNVTPGGTVVGRIEPSQGDVSGRRIQLMSGRGLFGWRNTKSDAEGRFTIEHVVPQKYMIELRPEGYPDRVKGKDRSGIRRSITVSEGETTEVVFGAERSKLHLAGRVMCGGTPVAGVMVHAFGEGAEDRNQKPVTQSDGRFELDVDGPGEYAFTLTMKYGSGMRIDRMIDAGTTEIDLEVPCGKISGVVLSHKDKPLSRVSVSIVMKAVEDPPDPKRFFERYRRTYTDEKGAFEFEMLAPGTYTLRAPDGHWRDRPGPRTPHGGVVLTDLQVGSGPIGALTIKLAEEGHVAVEVVDAAGTPVGNATLQVTDASNVERFAYRELQTEADGTFVIHSLAPGVYTVSAQKAGKRGFSPVTTVEAGQTAKVKIQLP